MIYSNFKIAISIIFFLSLCIVSSKIKAAPSYAFRVKFKDKNGTLTFADSLQFLSAKALQRRSKQGIDLDSTDLPIVPAYMDAVLQVGNIEGIHNRSKWFNQIVVTTYDSSKAISISALPMVASVEWVGYYASGIFKTEETESTKFASESVEPNTNKITRGNSAYYGNGFQQVDIIEADCLHDMGFKGEEMNIAIFDNAFKGADTCVFFDSIFSEGRLKDQYDFARDTAAAFAISINANHGYKVLSILASNVSGSFVGSAPKANYYTYITEDTRFEMPIEEDNWISAAEKSDSLGVDIINSSLGYNKFDSPLTGSNYTYTQMDGVSSMVVKGANMAVRKGIFVVNAMGNEAAGSWKFMITPADGDSVYSVGAVNGSGIWWSASSYGPTFDGRVKPDGVAMGQSTTLVGGCNLTAESGTSYACPVICGGIACLWQSLPHLNAWQLRQIVKMSSDKYNSPDNTYGYGLPNLCQAYNMVTGIDEVKNIDFRFALFPNPVTNSCKLKSYIGHINNFKYTLLDVSGKLIYMSKELYGTEFEIEVLRTLPTGNYVLQFVADREQYSVQVAKQ